MILSGWRRLKNEINRLYGTGGKFNEFSKWRKVYI